MAYYGAGGVFLFGLIPCLQRVLPDSSAGDCVVLTLAVCCCAVCTVWTGLASAYVSNVQVRLLLV